MNPWLGMGLVLAALGGCFLGLRRLGKLAPHPELLRKLMHVLMGLIAATFPWMFAKPWPVLLLAGLSLAALILVRGGVADSLLGVLHGVNRASWGELLFPVSIALLFVLAWGDALLYSVPILILALADAVAALIGVYYGRIHYTTLEADKSVEGSVAFMFVTFLCVHIALLLFTGVGRLESLLIAALLSIIMMMLEAIAWRGLDNLFIPVSGFALLKTCMTMEADDLVLKLVVLISLGIFVLVWRRRSTLDDSALGGAVLVGYAAWVVGGIMWLAVPLLTFVIGTVLAFRAGADPARNEHTVYALLSISGAGLAWLLAGEIMDDLFLPYALTFGAHLTMLSMAREHLAKETVNPARLMIWAVLPGWLVVMAPYVAMHGLSVSLPGIGVVTLALLLVSVKVFSRLQPGLSNCPVTIERWVRQALIAATVSLIGWLGLPYLTSGG